MSLVSLVGVSYALGARTLFDYISLAVNEGDRIALAGQNGSGKSTLLRLIAGEIEPDAGCVARRRGIRIQYVPQMLPRELATKTLFEAVSENAPVALRQHECRREVEYHLERLGFLSRFHSCPLGHLSGGEVNRALLARALMNEPDVILLDEPTNHMDVEQVERFEKFLQDDVTAAVILISHDRQLLDQVSSRTLFLRHGDLLGFNLSFSAARAALEAADRDAVARRKDEEREISRLKTSARRLEGWGRTYGNEKFSQRARSMEKRIERLKSELTPITTIARRDISLETSHATNVYPLVLDRFAVETRSGESLFTIEKLALRCGERLALGGENGCGKTTLIRAIVNRWMSDKPSQDFRFNPLNHLGYYDQELRHLDESERIIDAVARRCTLAPSRITSELVSSGFPFERHSSRISSLSGGERARLSLMMLRLEQPQLLLLDEPTNHLDIEGIEQLERTLVESDSTVLFVSHDRRFVERVATRIVKLHDCKM